MRDVLATEQSRKIDDYANGHSALIPLARISLADESDQRFVLLVQMRDLLVFILVSLPQVLEKK